MTCLCKSLITFVLACLWTGLIVVAEDATEAAPAVEVPVPAPETPPPPPPLEDILLEDFEQKRRDWTFEGSAFVGYGSGNYFNPGRANHGPLRIQGFHGQMMLKSWGPHGRNIDSETGRAVSSKFKIERKFLRFLMSGGHFPGRTCVNLLLDGNVVASVTGQNSHVMESVAFDVAPHLGKDVQIEVLDRVTGPWAHVCMDMLIQSNESGPARIVRGGRVAGDDRLWTRDGHLKGRLQWREDGSMWLSGKPVDLASVKSILLDRGITKNGQTLHAVGMRSGEFWHATIQTLKDGKLGINYHQLFGTRHVDLSDIASLEFAPGLDSSKANRPGVLYRTAARPLPGKLVWVKDNDVAVDSPLGIIPLPRKDLHRYIFPDSAVVLDPSMDEVALVDGTILRGKIEFLDGKIQMAHPILEKLQIDWKSIRYLVRAGNGISWLEDLERMASESIGPLGKVNSPVEPDSSRTDSRFLSTMRVSPRTTLRYRLVGPNLKAEQREFRAVLSPIPGSRGDSTIILSTSGREFYRQNLSARDKSRTLKLPLPVGDALELRVEFGKRMAYPCGIHLGDAQIAMLHKPGEVNQP